jgi:hypothetical protein
MDRAASAKRHREALDVQTRFDDKVCSERSKYAEREAMITQTSTEK